MEAYTDLLVVGYVLQRITRSKVRKELVQMETARTLGGRGPCQSLSRKGISIAKAVSSGSGGVPKAPATVAIYDASQLPDLVRCVAMNVPPHRPGEHYGTRRLSMY